MFVGIVSLMFIFFINYHVVDIITCLNLFYVCLIVGTQVQESIPSASDIATLPRVHT
jgi:hypothetical protein